MRRMYGDFQMANEYGPPLPQSTKRKREVDDKHPPGVPDIITPFDELTDENVLVNGTSYFTKWRVKRQANLKLNRAQNQRNSSSRPNIGPNPSSEPQSGR